MCDLFLHYKNMISPSLLPLLFGSVLAVELLEHVGKSVSGENHSSLPLWQVLVNVLLRNNGVRARDETIIESDSQLKGLFMEHAEVKSLNLGLSDLVLRE